MQLRRKVVQGVAWSAIDKWGTQLASFVVVLVLARLLSAEAFGLVAMATVFTNFLNMWVSQGMTEAIVQREKLTDDHVDTAFWANMVVSMLLALVGISLSGLIADLYNEPALRFIIIWLSLGLVINGLSQTQMAVLQRQMDFKSLAKRSVIAKLIAGVAGIWAAFAGFGAYSLVLQTLVNGTVAAIVLWRASDWRPSFKYSWARLRELYSFGINVTASQLIFFASSRLDDLIVGYFLGSTMLGYYRIGFTLIERLNSLIGGVIRTVAFATFSRLQQDSDRLQKALYQSVEYLTIVVFPVFLGVSLLSPDLVLLLFGEEWLPSIPIMQLLALATMIRTVLTLNGTAVTALGRPSWLVRVRGIEAVVRMIGFTIAAQHGIVEVAAVHLGTTLLLAPVHLKLTQMLANLSWRLYFAQYKNATIASVGMITTGIAMQLWLLYGISLNVRTMVQLLVLGAVYVIILFFTAPLFVRESGQLIKTNVRQIWLQAEHISPRIWFS